MTDQVIPLSRRGLARRLTVQALYQWLVNETPPERMIPLPGAAGIEAIQRARWSSSSSCTG